MDTFMKCSASSRRAACALLDGCHAEQVAQQLKSCRHGFMDGLHVDVYSSTCQRSPTLAEQTRPGCKRFPGLLQAEDLRAAVQFLQGQGFKVEAILGERLGSSLGALSSADWAI